MSSLMELVLPHACIGCDADGSPWCSGCIEVEFDPVLHRPDPCPLGMPTAAAAASYAGSVRSAVLAAKERDRRELDRPLGVMLAGAIALLGASEPWGCDLRGPLWLVPVPARPATRRERGRDHVSDWTEVAARWLRAAGVQAYRVPVLRRQPGGLDSVGLAADQRAANLDGAFSAGRVGRLAPGARLVVVDDIVTTGATLAAAGGCLLDAVDLERAQLGAAVVAATQRRRG